MGNCLVLLQQDVVRIMKIDGKILEYKAPIKVDEVLKQFPCHAISSQLSLPHYLHHNTTLLQGHLYYLVPLPPKRVMMFAEADDDHPVEEGGDDGHVVRIKLVVSKQELKHMLQHGGISVNEVLSLVQNHKRIDGVDVCNIVKDNHASQGWKPALETIPE